MARGIEAGRYVYVDRWAAPQAQDKSESDDSSPIDAGLFDLLAAPGTEHGVLWVDDRYVTGFLRSQSNVVVGSVEVLNALKRAGEISPDEWRKKLLALRRGGGAFLPLTVEEVVPALLAAKITDDRVEETTALTILRRNFSAALLLDAHLQIGPSEHPSLKGRPDEMAFLHSARQVMQACLVAIWEAPEATTDTCRAQSQWLWSSLRMERCIRTLPGNGNELLATLLVAGLLTSGLFLSGEKGKTLERRRAYLQWLDEVTTNPRADDARFLDFVATHLKGLLRVRRDKIPGDPSFLERLIQVQTQLLPQSIRQRLLADQEFTSNVNMVVGETITVASVEFKLSAFWRACTRAMRKGKASTKSFAGDVVKFRSDGDAVVLSGAASGRLAEPVLSILRLDGEGEAHRVRGGVYPRTRPGAGQERRCRARH